MHDREGSRRGRGVCSVAMVCRAKLEARMLASQRSVEEGLAIEGAKEHGAQTVDIHVSEDSGVGELTGKVMSGWSLE
jgi:hypothetical protein